MKSIHAEQNEDGTYNVSIIERRKEKKMHGNYLYHEDTDSVTSIDHVHIEMSVYPPNGNKDPLILKV